MTWDARTAGGRTRRPARRLHPARRSCRSAELGVDALGLHGNGVKPGLGREASLALSAERLGLAQPRLALRGTAFRRERVEKGLARLPRVGLDADGDRIVAADVPALHVDLDDRRPGADVAVVEVRRELAEAGADGQDQVGAA